MTPQSQGAVTTVEPHGLPPLQPSLAQLKGMVSTRSERPRMMTWK